MATNIAFSLVLIDSQLTDIGRRLAGTISVSYECPLSDGTRADYFLCDRHGRSIAVIESTLFPINPGDAADQAKSYAYQLCVPYIFLSNGAELLFW